MNTFSITSQAIQGTTADASVLNRFSAGAAQKRLEVLGFFKELSR